MTKSVFDMYDMRVVDTKKKKYIIPSFPCYMDEDAFSRPLETERIMCIEITESSLNRLEDELAYYHNALKNHHNYHVSIDRENYLRRNNAAVKKAWENYRMLLRLAAEGKVID